MTRDEILVRLREENERLTDLLEKPEPGLISWWMLLGVVLSNISGIYTGHVNPERETKLEDR